MKQKDGLQVVGFLIYFTTVIAVPVARPTRDVFQGNISSFATDECISEDIIYKAGDEVPSPGPCEQCVCQPPKVECTMIKCKANSGCKMIQRSNHCCPDYMCDCEYKGRLYNNGERLELEDTPCQVCYCKGGETMCTSITCYERTDCQPKYVPGQCCPRYDHCPLETNGNSTVNSTVIGSKREIQPWLMTNAVTVKPIEVAKQTTLKPPEEHTPPNVYPQTLKIHEILPTTVKYDHFQNGKRPALSTVIKASQAIHFNEKTSIAPESTTLPNAETSPAEHETSDSDYEKATASQYSASTLEPNLTSSSDDYYVSASTTIENISNNSTTNTTSENIEQLDSLTGFSTESVVPDINTESSQLNITHEIIPKEENTIDDMGQMTPKGDALDNKGNLILEGPIEGENVIPETISIGEGRILPEDEVQYSQDIRPSTETIPIRDLSYDGEEMNSINPNPGSSPDSLTSSLEPQNDIPNSEPYLDSAETLGTTSGSFTVEMEPLVSGGGIYEELNDTLFYTDDNDVKQDEVTDENSSGFSTTEKINDLRSEFEPSTSALYQVFDKFETTLPESSSSIRRSDEWPSDTYQLIHEESSEESDERLLDLNVGATSHSNTRVSPANFFTADSKESYVMNGRSLSPFNEKSLKEILYTSKGEPQTTKFVSDLNSIVTEKSNLNETSQSLESKLADAMKLSPDEGSDLYLSIIGTNPNSNETILHMILTPTDLKHLAKQLVKENVRSPTTPVTNETEVKIEWLTKEQLSQMKPAKPSSSVNLKLANCSFTNLGELRAEKIEADENELNSTAIPAVSSYSYPEDNFFTQSATELNEPEEGSTVGEYSSTVGEYPSDIESSPSSYFARDGTEDIQSSQEPVTSTELDNSSPQEVNRLKKQNLGIESSTIKIYEIRPTGHPSDRLMESYATTEGPYTLDKLSTADTTSFQSDQSNSAENISVSETDKDYTSDNRFESTTNASPVLSEKSKRKNLPNVEPFLRQLPSTLDEKDVSILRDFLEKHLSEPNNR